MNKSIIDANGKPAHFPARIYIDDALLLAQSRTHMEMVLAALIEAIFMIMGKPAMDVWKCPLAMDKWQIWLSGQNTQCSGWSLTPTKQLPLYI